MRIEDSTKRARFHAGFVMLLVLSVMSGCAMPARIVDQAGGNAYLFGQFKAYDGASGDPISFTQIVARAREADIILFGEEHSDVVCNALEAQLLGALVGGPRPVALAMEFFEADTQTPLDAYLSGRLDEPDFRK